MILGNSTIRDVAWTITVFLLLSICTAYISANVRQLAARWGWDNHFLRLWDLIETLSKQTLRDKWWLWACLGLSGGFGIALSVEPPAQPAQTGTPQIGIVGAEGTNKPHPEYLRNIAIVPAFSSDQLPLFFGGTPTRTVVGKLRIFVDYSTHRNGWMPRIRAPIGDISDPVEDQAVRIQLIYSGRPEGAGNNDLWWGDPIRNTVSHHRTFRPIYLQRQFVLVLWLSVPRASPSTTTLWFFVVLMKTLIGSVSFARMNWIGLLNGKEGRSRRDLLSHSLPPTIQCNGCF